MGEMKATHSSETGKTTKPLLFEEFNQTLKQLEQQLYEFPIDSEQHSDIQKKIEELLKSHGGKYDKFVLCFPNVRHPFYFVNCEKDQDDELLEWASDHLGVEKLESEFDEKAQLFSQQKTFVADPKFTAIPRYQAEYNLKFKQIVVCSYITDGRNVILLHTKKGGQTRIEDRYTMIQGHVEFDRRAYIVSQYQFLFENALKEFHEEIKTDMKLPFPFKPKFFVSTRNNHIDLEHFGVVYEIFVPDAEKVYERLTSGEEYKHSVVMFNIFEEYEENVSKLDAWVKCVIDRLRFDF